jgi:pimeloyl-ACP methyl ester carboxylesterase
MFATREARLCTIRTIQSLQKSVCRAIASLYSAQMHKFLGLLVVLALVLSSAGAEKFVALGTNKVSYTDTGSGSNAVVLVHGWGGSKELWREQIAHLERSFRVLAVDLPGFGKSDKPKTNYTMAFLAEGVNAAMQDAKIEKAALVGFSMGTPVISAFYKSYPAKVAGLVALDGTLRGFTIPPDRLEEILKPYRTEQYQEAARQFFATLFPNPGTEKLRDEVVEVLLKTPAHVLFSSFEQMADADTWKVSRISVPLLVINATNPLWTDEYKEYVKTLQPKATYKEVQGTGHFLQLEKPAEVNALLREFLSSVFSSKSN